MYRKQSAETPKFFQIEIIWLSLDKETIYQRRKKCVDENAKIAENEIKDSLKIGRYRKMTGQKKIGHSESTQHWVDTKCPNNQRLKKGIKKNVQNGQSEGTEKQRAKKN